MRGFEIYAQANAIDKASDKLNCMLHYTGQKVQLVFNALPEIETDEGPFLSVYVFPRNEYYDALEKLNGFFEPKQNVSFERHLFRQQRQSKGERFDIFLMRLREQFWRAIER